MFFRYLQNFSQVVKRQFSCSIPPGKKIIIALSGGVDSTAAGMILKEKYGKTNEIHGIHIKSWAAGANGDDDENTSCPALTTDEDFMDASLVAECLGVSLTRIDLVRDYWLNVFEPMLQDYSVGLTVCSNFNVFF